jgi:hypothetical protein
MVRETGDGRKRRATGGQVMVGSSMDVGGDPGFGWVLLKGRMNRVVVCKAIDDRAQR